MSRGKEGRRKAGGDDDDVCSIEHVTGRGRERGNEGNAGKRKNARLSCRRSMEKREGRGKREQKGFGLEWK